ncbi:MAG: hypothetical protein QMC90_00130 [Dehalococcoidales bacterium]|nr:hypothetical protein [Dehalococcoidales bacterium]
MATAITDRYGSFDTTFDVPVMALGTYDVKTREKDGDNWDEVALTIRAGASLSPATGNVGTEVTVSGTGFIPSGTVIIAMMVLRWLQPPLMLMELSQLPLMSRPASAETTL